MYVARLPLLLFLLAGSIAPRVIAVNLVVNPSFAGNMSGWTIPPGTIFDGARDATGVPGSGSARVSTEFIDFAPFGRSGPSQCIAAGPGSYTLGGKIDAGCQGGCGNSGGAIEVLYFSGTDCTTALIGSDGGVRASTPAYFQALSKTIIAPAGTTHILITAKVFGLSGFRVGLGIFSGNFDDFVLDKDAEIIPAIEPSGLLALILAVAAIGTFVLRR
jgi:hypothetical protein